MDLKKLLGQLPEPIRSIAGIVARYKIINSKTFLKQYQELEAFSKLSESEKTQLQFQRLKESLIIAYKNCPYYTKLFNEVGFNPYDFQSIDEFQKIPLLTKDIIRDNQEELQNGDISQFYYATSGGTTGTPIQIAFENQSLYKERAFVYHYWSKFGYDYKTSKLLSFREASFDKKPCMHNTMYNELLINPYLLDSTHIRYIVKKADSFNAEFLYGYPSTIAPFCVLLKKYQLSLKSKISAIFLISENLYKDQLEQIRGVFSCPIAMFYGHTEKTVFAEQVEGLYYFNQLYGYTEILPKDGDNIVCTGFINRKMPLIRYLLDDRAEKKGAGYEITGHRECEYLYGKNDYVISATTVEFTHEGAFEKVSRYQFVQDEIGKVKMYIECIEPLTDLELDSIKQCVAERLTGFEINIYVVNSIQRTKRGKHKMIIQNIER